MKTKKLKKLMTAALCVIFALCFAFPASAYTHTVNHDESHENGTLTVKYRGKSILGNSFISCEVVLAAIHPELPTEIRVCTVLLTMKNLDKTETKVVYATNNDYSVSKTKYTNIDPAFYRFEYDACGYEYTESNFTN